MLSQMQDLGKEVAVSSFHIYVVLEMKRPYCSVVDIHHQAAVTGKMLVLSVEHVSLILQYFDIPFTTFQS